MQMQLNDLGRGFSQPALCSQSVFRHVLAALSLPASLQVLDPAAALQGMDPPQGAHPAAAAVLLALLDQDCKLWLSPGFMHSDAAPWLRFHTGCTVVSELAEADFAWVAAACEVPPLSRFPQGNPQYPDQSATCIVQVDGLQAPDPAMAWTLSGPGVNGCAQLQVDGLGAEFLAQWRASQLHFPCGVDFLFTHGQTFVGLPRSTQIQG